MSQTKNNTPIIIGVVALLIALGAGGFIVSKNMKKDEAPATTAEASSSTDQASTSPASGPLSPRWPSRSR